MLFGEVTVPGRDIHEQRIGLTDGRSGVRFQMALENAADDAFDVGTADRGCCGDWHVEFSVSVTR